MDENLKVNASSAFDESKSYLGNLCKYGHDYRGTGMSVRQLSNKACRYCLVSHATKPKTERRPHNKTPEEYWRNNVAVTDNVNDCWVWTGCLKDKNRERGTYGVWSCSEKINGVKPKSSHRATYILFVGDIAEGLVVRHKCDNPVCCNPAHLETGTIADNNRDRDERGRLVYWRHMDKYKNRI